ncbi:MAG TPA: hypothetical protein PKA88_40165, partial [Polyangiaceae bacterium]|nr:hypothetical protein [Polyangiaceae bacterium]
KSFRQLMRLGSLWALHSPCQARAGHKKQGLLPTWRATACTATFRLGAKGVTSRSGNALK